MASAEKKAQRDDLLGNETRGGGQVGIILAVQFIPAKAHDSKGLVPLVKKVRKQRSQGVLVEKGHKSEEIGALPPPVLALHIQSATLSFAYSPKIFQAAVTAETNPKSSQYSILSSCSILL